MVWYRKINDRKKNYIPTKWDEYIIKLMPTKTIFINSGDGTNKGHTRYYHYIFVYIK